MCLSKVMGKNWVAFFVKGQKGLISRPPNLCNGGTYMTSEGVVFFQLNKKHLHLITPKVFDVRINKNQQRIVQYNRSPLCLHASSDQPVVTCVNALFVPTIIHKTHASNTFIKLQLRRPRLSVGCPPELYSLPVLSTPLLPCRPQIFSRSRVPSLDFPVPPRLYHRTPLSFAPQHA